MSKFVCTWVTDPDLGRPCGKYIQSQLWKVFRREGTGWYLVTEPLIRCGEHLGATVARLAKDDYDTGYLDHVEPVVPRRTR